MDLMIDNVSTTTPKRMKIRESPIPIRTPPEMAQMSSNRVMLWRTMMIIQKMFIKLKYLRRINKF